MTTVSDLKQGSISMRLIAVLAISAATLFPGAASAHALIQNGALGTTSPAVYRAYGLAGPLTVSPASASAFYRVDGMEGPLTVSPASASGVYRAYGLAGPLTVSPASANQRQPRDCGFNGVSDLTR